MSKSSQTFRIIHAPEHPPLTAEELRYLLWREYPKSEWEVWEETGKEEAVKEITEDEEGEAAHEG